ncbi:MAG TPA: hypothetical protein VNQ57_12300, partial [Ureibacillus sp.]|nr:hypothetical protein [Ureibacillus sp.]
AAKWRLYCFSLPLFFGINSKVALIPLLSATFLRKRQQSGAYTPSLCHFSSETTTKWRLYPFSLPLFFEYNLKVAFIEVLKAIFH